MTARCYFRPGTKEIIWGIGCDTLVTDDSADEELKAQGWFHSPYDFEKKAAEPVVDEALEILRKAAKERGIKGWARMGEETLRAALGLNDGGQEE